MPLSLTRMLTVTSSNTLETLRTNLIKLKRRTFSLLLKCAHSEFCGFRHEDIFEHFASGERREKSFFMAFDFCCWFMFAIRPILQNNDA